MTKHELSLFENAIDSLNEALKKYQEGNTGEPKAFKFCILHISHFFELILKYYVSLSHPLLLYTNPFAKNLNKNEAHTITFTDAINFLKNEGSTLSPEFEADLAWLKKLRNHIEHHAFSMNVDEVQETVGRLMSAVHRFDSDHKNINLSQFIDGESFELFNKLANTYEARLAQAIKEVEQAEQKAYRGLRLKEISQVDFHIYHCYECGHDTMIPNKDSESGYQCTFCRNEESDDIEIHCGVCDDIWTRWDMSYTDFHGDGEKIYVCPRCSGDPDYWPD